MKLISAIYRRCSPRLRDEWLTTREFDGDRDAEDMVMLTWCQGRHVPVINMD